jgi:hypothetical protein
MYRTNKTSVIVLAASLAGSASLIAATWPHRSAELGPLGIEHRVEQGYFGTGLQSDKSVIGALRISDLRSRDDVATAMLQCSGFLKFLHQEASKGRATMPAEGAKMVPLTLQLEDFGKQHAAASSWSAMRVTLQMATGIDYARNESSGISQCASLLEWQISGQLDGLGSEMENFGFHSAQSN